MSQESHLGKYPPNQSGMAQCLGGRQCRLTQNTPNSPEHHRWFGPKREGEPLILFHGGIAGLRVGDRILPGQSRAVCGCPVCRDRMIGISTPFDPATPEGWVYATEDRQYARFYASMTVRGDLYRVRMDEGAERSLEDLHFPSWRARGATVISVLERYIQLTNKERRRLFIRWGGIDWEFQAMMAQMQIAAQRGATNAERP